MDKCNWTYKNQPCEHIIITTSHILMNIFSSKKVSTFCKLRRLSIKFCISGKNFALLIIVSYDRAKLNNFYATALIFIGLVIDG